MRKAAILMGAVALIVGATNASAQGKNFAGTWTVVVDPAAAPAPGRGGGRGLGQGGTIAQDAKTLTVPRTTQNGEMKSVYNLDGADSKNTLTMGGNAVEQLSKAKWDGDKLIVTTTMNFNGNASESTMAMWLDASGMLVVESTGAGRGGGPPTTTRMMYKKS
ncbi:MAG: hypothetical protein ABIT20_07085 [Gemmatimonadaceae bacterium]